ncbi:MAG TPA: hypothetical protein PLI88_04160 [Bacillota bacterium]|nr:hypothetical protein [Bacillota bacterium]HPI01330.1 hypothetical protein [Bacillota bacterium]HPM63729.1 hypothetical protein [Bacillota bacterium]
MKARFLRRAAAAITVLLLFTLTGCMLKFTVTGDSSYLVRSDGKVFNGSLVEDVMQVDVEVTGFIPTLPTVLEVELEGLIMSMSMDAAEVDQALDWISDYLYDLLDFDSCSFDTATDTFVVYGEFTLADFLGAIGMSAPQLSFGPIPLSNVIGQETYDNLISRIAYVSGYYTEPATTIDYSLTGALKTATGRVVGSFELWFDGLNPAV